MLTEAGIWGNLHPPAGSLCVDAPLVCPWEEGNLLGNKHVGRTKLDSPLPTDSMSPLYFRPCDEIVLSPIEEAQGGQVLL